MTARKRLDAEPPIEITNPDDEAESAPQARDDYGGLGSMIAREVAIQARRDRARREFFRIEHTSPETPGKPESKFLGLYRITGESSISYDVLIRDPNPEHFVNRCSCPDYEQNNLGTCKHVEAVMSHIRRKHAPQIRAAKPRLLEVNRLTVYITLRYVGDGTWTAAPVYDHALDPGLLRLLNHYLLPYLHLLESNPPRFLERLSRFLEEVDDFGGTAVVEPEVYDYAETAKGRAERDARRRELISAVEAGQARLDLLNLPLYPYQAVGTLFLAFTERALLADDLGLGKTPQSIAAARLLKEWHDIKKVLVVTPASVKFQWGREIERFTDDSYVVVGGTKQKRARQYEQELVLHDHQLRACATRPGAPARARARPGDPGRSPAHQELARQDQSGA